MNRVKVLIPFLEKETGKIHAADSEVSISDETLANLKAISPNMVIVLDSEDKTIPTEEVELTTKNTPKTEEVVKPTVKSTTTKKRKTASKSTAKTKSKTPPKKTEKK